MHTFPKASVPTLGKNLSAAPLPWNSLLETSNPVSDKQKEDTAAAIIPHFQHYSVLSWAPDVASCWQGLGREKLLQAHQEFWTQSVSLKMLDLSCTTEDGKNKKPSQYPGK